MQRVISSGALAADTAVMAYPCTFMGALLVSDATNAVTLILYDHASSASGTSLGKISIGASPAAGALTQGLWFGPNGIQCTNGIYADVAQVTGTILFYVYYR